MIQVRLKEQNGPDHVFSAELDGHEVGQIHIRLEPFVHSLEVTRGMTARRATEALINYTKGYLAACGYESAVMVVEQHNTRMQAFLANLPVVCDQAVDVYTIGIK